MRNYLAVIGYVLVILGAVFIDTPFIALLAIPVFIAGAIMLAISYHNLLTGKKELGLLGILIMLIILGYSAIEFNQYLVRVKSYGLNGVENIGWIKTDILLFLYVIASYCVYLGVEKNKKRTRYRSQKDWWIAAMVLIPLVIVTILIMYWSGFWLGG